MTQIAAPMRQHLNIARSISPSAPPERGFWSAAWLRFRQDRVSFNAAAVLFVIWLACLAAPLISDLTGYGPTEMDLTRPNAAPSVAHPFGGDEYGRDYLIRSLWAGRVSLTMGIAVAVVALVLGVTVGLTSGYIGGWFDDAMSAVVNLVISLPSFFLLVVIATLIRPNLFTLTLVIGGLGWVSVARQVRGTVLSVREREYVLAARVLGATNFRIMLRHILPNVTSIIVVVAGFEVAAGILAESGVSFIGLGVQPPDASWGNMLTNSLRYVYSSPWLVTFPGLFIFVSVACIYLVADGLREAFDPKS